MKLSPGSPAVTPQEFVVDGNHNTTSALVYIAASSNQLTLSSGSWPSWAVGATICVPGAGQSYTTNAAGTVWVGGTTYQLGDLVTWNGLAITPYNAPNSDAFFTASNWYSVLGSATAIDLQTTIIAIDGSVATLADNAATTVSVGSPSTCWYGIDDSDAINAAIALCVASGGGIVSLDNVGVWQAQNILVPSGVEISGNGASIRPSMPITKPIFLIRQASGNSVGASVSGFTVSYTGIQAEKYSGGVWTRRNIGAVFVDAATDWGVYDITGVDLTGGNVLQVQPTTANFHPIRGKIRGIISTQTSGYGQMGFGAVQIDGATAVTISDVTSYSMGRALNLEADNSSDGPRVISGIVASDIRQAGSGSPFNQGALALIAHANTIYDVSASSVYGTGGGSGINLTYSTGGSISSCSFNGVIVSGGGVGLGVGNNNTFTGVSVSNMTVDGANVTNQSNSRPYAAVLFTAGMTFTNCVVTNGHNSGFQSAFFDGSVGPLALGTVTFNSCDASGNGSGVLTTYGYENNYTQHVVCNNCTSESTGNQTWDMFMAAGTDAILTSCSIATRKGPGSYTIR